MDQRRIFAREEQQAVYSGEYNSPFARLPPELVAQVAANTPFNSRRDIPQVCRRWAAVCVNNIALWTILDFEDATDVSSRLLESLLQRSHSAPVELRNLSLYGRLSQQRGYGPEAEPLRNFANVLVRHMARISVLELDLHDYDNTADLNLGLISPAPLLRRARLTLPYFGHLALPVELFGGRLGAPHLRELDLTYCNWAPHMRAPAASVLNCVTCLSIRAPALGEADIRRLLTAFPTIYDIDVIFRPYQPNPFQPVSLSPELGPRLSVWLFQLDHQTAQGLQRLLHIHLRCISVFLAEGDVLPMLFENDQNTDAELSITPSKFSPPMVIAFDFRLTPNWRSTVNRTSITSFHRCATILSQRHVFRNVRKLSLSCLEDLILRDFNPFVIAQRMQHLRTGMGHQPQPVRTPSVTTWSALFPRLEEVDITLPPLSAMNSSTVFGDRNLRDLLSRTKRVTLRAQPGETYSVAWDTFCIGFTTSTAEPMLCSPDDLKLFGVQIRILFPN
ncbi:hypothetical protein EXIGLDRAFT_770035 [Exidia glandulosa HHB12029]|uniref:F-box domain-containing protein n=1 Tax=Exidia glandulosa HHB12029 TaxID=1314781 RepID=A0A165H1H7_EXIGL|nr:hypothetical protein EXIGLDRAFT_770035 [Exidia glandulosa HHB12029]